ncbi:MAG: prepilin-type N-terminal cleavage/methylation domain-containing protein [Elusimicrobiaceae bacterium]|nr:prepilin-type N-terminal cleavage/methylation domain-containing protein [Elusimicrobiaceae bacterium]
MKKKNGLLGRLDIKAFTLIELLVVVLIIGILAVVALPQYEKSVMKSRYSALMATTNALAEAEEVYYLANGEYTQDFEALSVEPSGCTLSDDKTTCTYPWGSCVLNINESRVACVNAQTLSNGYAQYFKHGSRGNWDRTCWAISSNDNDKYNDLCKRVGATTRFFGSTNAICPPYGHCSIWKF